VKSGRLELNEYLQSVSNRPYMPPVMRANGPPLLRIESRREIAAATCSKATAEPNYTGSRAFFSVPPIAAVGLSEAEARNRDSGFA